MTTWTYEGETDAWWREDGLVAYVQARNTAHQDRVWLLDVDGIATTHSMAPDHASLFLTENQGLNADLLRWRWEAAASFPLAQVVPFVDPKPVLEYAT